MRRGLALALLALLLGVSIGAWIIADRADAQQRGSGQTVVFGDSLTWAAADDLRAIDRTPVVWAAPGFSLPAWEPLVLAAADQRPRVVVLALGGNDSLAPDPSATWDRVLDRLAGRGVCTVVVDQRSVLERQRRFDGQLQRVLVEHPEVRRLPWGATAAAHPEWIGPDGIHHTPRGEAAYGFALWLATRSCP